MKLSEVINHLHNARAAHKAWVARAEGLVAGLPLEKEQVPLLPTDCIFGKWYYGSGQLLRSLPAYTALEKPHDELHRTYMHIFKLLFNEPSTSMMGRLFGQQKKLKASQLKQAEAMLVRLRGLSDQVCDILSNLEQQVTAAAKKQSNTSTINRTIGS